MHVKGHVKSCQEKYSPSLIKDLDAAQTIICEQRNFWIGGYKHNVKHMNQARFIMYLYVIFTYYNEVIAEGVINIANTNQIYNHCKRKIAQIHSSDESSDDQQLNIKTKKINI